MSEWFILQSLKQKQSFVVQSSLAPQIMYVHTHIQIHTYVHISACGWERERETKKAIYFSREEKPFTFLKTLKPTW